MNIAINENYKDTQGEYQSDTYWRTIVAWGKTAEIAERFLVKGSEVAIDGKLVTPTYSNAQGKNGI